ncbi:hypothetical protein J3S90_15440 [Flavobacterium sp. P4023]|uniref:RiboL-PSP-HEPN domain-containing protein n=1 Tax=Flavobacterium flabelliforme TaxID=2816119 RepID=A0ABS5CX74_9FLAO|nr:HEPN domain-containing protein [Flavobacterium flabelliforme]MBP4143198.1 hypothetical protein [Flavobacterium flabelliforme]
MDKSSYLDSYMEQYTKLVEIIDETNKRLISDEPDKFIVDNVNFFTKSFLVMMCAYLESYLKDALMVIIDDVNLRLDSTKIPHNLIKWTLNIEKEFKETEYKFEHLKIKLKKKELDEYISGNPFKTRDLFKKFGIPLDKNETFNLQKDIINTIVVKRNKVVHHNDEASDISNNDLKDFIEILRNYLTNIDKEICRHIA